MIDFLCAATQAADRARVQGLAAVPAPELAQFHARFDALLDHGERLNPCRSPPAGTRRRIKQSPAYNLIARLRKHRDATLRFLSDLRVPFDNNQAERDVRMPKLKQQTSPVASAPRPASRPSPPSVPTSPRYANNPPTSSSPWS